MIDNEKSFREHFAPQFAKLNPRQAKFFMLFLNTGLVGPSYKEAYGVPNQRDVISTQLGSRLLKKAGFEILDMLEYMGHTDDKVCHALDALYIKDPDKYLNHIEKIRQLDNKKLELTGSISIPIINIVTSRRETDV